MNLQEGVAKSIDFMKRQKEAGKPFFLYLPFAHRPKRIQMEASHLAEDYSQANDLAAKNPDKLKNILRDPFETTVGGDSKSLLGYAGALAAPSTAIAQQLWLKELESYVAFPPAQDPASCNPTTRVSRRQTY